MGLAGFFPLSSTSASRGGLIRGPSCCSTKERVGHARRGRFSWTEQWWSGVGNVSERPSCPVPLQSSQGGPQQEPRVHVSSCFWTHRSPLSLALASISPPCPVMFCLTRHLLGKVSPKMATPLLPWWAYFVETDSSITAVPSVEVWSPHLHPLPRQAGGRATCLKVFSDTHEPCVHGHKFSSGHLKRTPRLEVRGQDGSSMGQGNAPRNH